MKRTFLILGLFTAMLGVSLSTLTAASIVKVESRKQDQKKVEIPASSLPDKISKGITDANKDSKITKAYKLVEANGDIAGYEVVVVTNAKETTLKFDKNGEGTM